MHEYVYIDAQSDSSYLCHWKAVPVGTKLQGIYLVLYSQESTSTYVLGYQRKISLQLDDPLGAVIFQDNVILTNQGTTTIGSDTYQTWNGFLPLDIEISSPGSYTLLYNGKPDDMESAAALTNKAAGIIQGTAFRVR